MLISETPNLIYYAYDPTANVSQFRFDYTISEAIALINLYQRLKLALKNGHD